MKSLMVVVMDGFHQNVISRINAKISFCKIGVIVEQCFTVNKFYITAFEKCVCCLLPKQLIFMKILQLTELIRV